MSELQQNPSGTSQQIRESAKDSLSSQGGLATVSKKIADLFKMPNLKLFGSEKAEIVERREDWLSNSQFADSRKDMKKDLLLLINLLEGSDDIEANAQAQKERLQNLINQNLATVFDKTRPLEKTWRELALFYTNAAQKEVRNLVVVNANIKQLDEEVIVSKLTEMISEVNKSAIDMSKNFSLFVLPNYDKLSLIERLSKLANDNKVLLLTDYKDLESVDSVLDVSNEEGKPKLGGVEKSWSRTVAFANYGLLRDKYSQEKRELYGTPSVAVAGKLYEMKNLAQPVAGAQHGALKGFSGLHFKVNMDEVNRLDAENLNPLTLAFGSIMPFNCLTLFKGENVELRQYSVIRTIDYVDKLLKHYLNQILFTAIGTDEQLKKSIHKTISDFLKALKDEKILKAGEIIHFEQDPNNLDRIDLKLKLTPMFVASAVDYTLEVDDKNHKINSSADGI